MSDTQDPVGEPSEPPRIIPPPPSKRDAGTTDDDDGDDGPTYRAEDLDRVATKNRKQGAAAERRRLLEELGVEDLKSVRELLDAARAAEEAEMSDAQRAKAAAEEARRAADAELVSARRMQIESRLERALRQPGGEDQPSMREDRLDKAVSLVIDDVIGSDGEIDEAIGEAVAALRADLPEWFGSPSTADDGGTKTPGTPRRSGSERKPPPSGIQAEIARIAARRKASAAPPMPMVET